MAKAKRQPSWIFILGVVLAIIWGFFSWFVMLPYNIPQWFLIVVGLIMGIVNVTKAEVKSFLIAGTVLIITAYLSSQVLLDLFFPYMLESLIALFAPAVIVVALRESWRLAESK